MGANLPPPRNDTGDVSAMGGTPEHIRVGGDTEVANQDVFRQYTIHGIPIPLPVWIEIVGQADMWKPATLSNSVAGAIHDQLGKEGVTVTNGRGEEPWKMMGDDHMDPTSQRLATEAVAASAVPAVPGVLTSHGCGCRVSAARPAFARKRIAGDDACDEKDRQHLPVYKNGLMS